MLYRTVSPAALALALAGVLLVAAGCDTSFRPFAETDRAFSVFGYLDLYADTQWVRVDALQDSALVGGEDVGARVRTRNLQTGEVVTWRDSAFAVGATGRVVHNFYTTAGLQPGATYRFFAEREAVGDAGAMTTSARVSVPARFPPPDVPGRVLPNGEGTKVIHATVQGVRALGTVKVDLHYTVCPEGPRPPVEQEDVYSYLPAATRQEDGSYRIRIPWYDDILQDWPDGSTICGVDDFQIRIASVSEDWPAYGLPVDSMASAPLPPFGTHSNVEGGVGFLGGAATRTVDVLAE